MKKFIFFLMLSMTIILGSCQEKQARHEVYQKDNGEKIVYVQIPNNDGTFSNFWMNYVIFNSLFNNGGYTNVYRTYNQSPAQYSVSSAGARRLNEPSTSSGSNYSSYSSSSRSSSSSPSRSSYSSSSSSRSMSSSPSRSSYSSSSSRSMSSSPSRSSSSSRSMSSSPSRR